eukprot:m.23323 g.23323  ORF g.23323 m.23323 type:complete len:101 (-) comp7130_c0_seq1:67-369(-)
MVAKGKVEVDDPRNDNVVEYVSPFTVTDENPQTDPMHFVAMLFSTAALFTKIPYLAWCSVFCAAIAMANAKSRAGRQFSALLVSMPSLVLCYMQPTPKPT